MVLNGGYVTSLAIIVVVLIVRYLNRMLLSQNKH